MKTAMKEQRDAALEAAAHIASKRRRFALHVTAGFDQYGEHLAIILHAPTRDGKAKALRAIRGVVQARREAETPPTTKLLGHETMDAAQWLAGDICQCSDVGGE